MSGRRPFVFQWGNRPWPADLSLLHIYIPVDLALDGHADLRALIESARASVRDIAITPVADPWLHITLDQITDQPGTEIDADERVALADELGPRVTGR